MIDGKYGYYCVSMPVRAFLDSDPMERSRKSTMYPVSMPVRAFLDSDM